MRKLILLLFATFCILLVPSAMAEQADSDADTINSESDGDIQSPTCEFLDIDYDYVMEYTERWGWEAYGNLTVKMHCKNINHYFRAESNRHGFPDGHRGWFVRYPISDKPIADSIVIFSHDCEYDLAWRFVTLGNKRNESGYLDLIEFIRFLPSDFVSDEDRKLLYQDVSGISVSETNVANLRKSGNDWIVVSDCNMPTMVEIFNASGQVIRNIKVSDSNHIIPSSELPSGMLFVRITNNHDTKTFKIIN